MSAAWVSRTVTLAGLRTHYLEAGEGPAVVLLHSGEFGGSAETSWATTIPALSAAGFRVIAPDWLGFGLSDKVVDFSDPVGRRIQHMATAVEHLGGQNAAFVGSSMGGTYLSRLLAAKDARFPAAAAVLVSGGGFVPDNEARRAIQDYDLSLEGMRRIIRTLTYRSTLADDDDYIRWRHELSLEPGAWECAAAARVRRPQSSTAASSSFGKPDRTAYEEIECPTLVVAGADDPLRMPGYATELAERIPDSTLVVYEECGHLPNLEHPDRFNKDLLAFLNQRYLSSA